MIIPSTPGGWHARRDAVGIASGPSGPARQTAVVPEPRYRPASYPSETAERGAFRLYRFALQLVFYFEWPAHAASWLTFSIYFPKPTVAITSIANAIPNAARLSTGELLEITLTPVIKVSPVCAKTRLSYTGWYIKSIAALVQIPSRMPGFSLVLPAHEAQSAFLRLRGTHTANANPAAARHGQGATVFLGEPFIRR